MKDREVVRCDKCSGRLVLEEVSERTACYEILDDGSYSSSPTQECEDFTYHVFCENGCCDTGFKFNPFAGRAIRVCEDS
jgi:hypothetical protein